MFRLSQRPIVPFVPADPPAPNSASPNRYVSALQNPPADDDTFQPSFTSSKRCRAGGAVFAGPQRL
jgi:hypothetical protein